MAASTKPGRLRPHARSFLDSLRAFLTPALWKQAEQARRAARRAPRWRTQPLVLTLLVMTWCCGDSQAERFVIAKGFTAVCLAKRRRPGQTVPGFQKALAHLPRGVLRALAAGVRGRLLALLDLVTDGWVVLGCDGSELEPPRGAELERYLDPPLKRRGVPHVWVTALVHLRTGLLWAWRLGKGHNRERSHLRALLPTLPAAALVVADAGYNGYDLAQALLAAGASFLIRASAKDTLYTEAALEAKHFSDGVVLCWPQAAQAKERPPLRLRLIRLRGTRRRRDVWLLTDVLDAGRLSVEQAGRYYRWRWENEGLFRTYKRTLAKVKLTSRSVRLIHREAEGALLALQLLLAQGVRALPARRSRCRPQRCSPRKVLLAIRDVILGRIGVRQARPFRRRLAQALREQRRRTSSKVKRCWPRKYKHRPPRPPKFLMLTEPQKALLAKILKPSA
jgi:Transposase DDE domain